MSQSAIPIVNIIYMVRDKPSVLRVRITMMAWGRKDADVKKAATKPIISILKNSGEGILSLCERVEVRT